jgi:hypothetical protein
MSLVLIFVFVALLFIAIRKNAKTKTTTPKSVTNITNSPTSLHVVAKTSPELVRDPADKSAKGASGTTPHIAGDFEKIMELLRANPGASAKELARISVATYGPEFDKTRLNSSLYRMENAGLVTRTLDGKTPKWDVK